MTLNILIVDDSPFFQRVLTDIINENNQFKVIGVANNGTEAIEKVEKLKPDIVTMDYEMPMMDGVTAVRNIMSTNPLPILMLSSMTFDGAKITIDALEAGAADFMTKNFAEISGKGVAIKKRLYDTFLLLGNIDAFKKNLTTTSSSAESTQSSSENIINQRNTLANHLDKKQVSADSTSQLSKKSLFEQAAPPKIVIIGASTGGPAALSQLLSSIPKNFPLPLLIVQHMPENFTLAFSQRLDKQCNIAVKEAEEGDRLIPGRALLAPGGKQLVITNKDNAKVSILEPTTDINYKPCVYITLASLSNSYGKDNLAIVLTGMGSDGCDGAKLLKESGATVWTQDKESCVVYGMPMAIDKAQLSNASLTLSKMTNHLSSL